MDLVAFDLEIAKEIPEGEELMAHRPLHITCAAACNHIMRDHIWHSGRGPARYSSWMEPTMAQNVADCLYKWHSRGATIVTWNGLGFDFDILAEECQSQEHKDRLIEVALGHVDMGFQMLCEKGFMCGLEAAALGMGLPGKLEGVTGAQAPAMWKQGVWEQEKVLAYVRQDVFTTMRVYQEILKTGKLCWVTKKGTVSKWTPTLKDGRMLTANECLELPLPDTSWMDAAWPREKFYGWTEKDASNQ
jgi:hypothetical protein